MKKHSLITKTTCLLLLILFLVGCNSRNRLNDDVTIIENNNLGSNYYPVLRDYKGSNTREQNYLYYTQSSSTHDYKELGRGLQLLSLEYFDNSQYYMQEGQLLNSSLYSNLLKRNSADNPDGLNSEGGSEVFGVVDGWFVRHIVEQDYVTYENQEVEIHGVSLAIVLERNHKLPDGTNIQLTDEQLKQFGMQSAYILSDVISSQQAIRGKDVPIMIALYVGSSDTDYSSGYFLSSILNDGGLIEQKDINQKRVLFPSAEATNLDATSASTFDQIRASIIAFFPEAVGVTGIGRYTDNQLVSLDVNIVAQAKTYTELVALVQYTANVFEEFYTMSSEVLIKVFSQDEQQAVIYHKVDNNKWEIIMF